MLFPTTFWRSAAAAASIAVGRSNSASTTGTGTTYSIGWSSGGAAANGTWIVFVARDNSANTPVVSGGSAWTQLGTSKVWYKQCGASEPTTYSVSYSGSAKGDTGCCTMVEILNASSMEASATGTSTNTPPALATITSGDIVVVVGGGSGSGSNGAITAPSGYTMASKRESADAVTAAATKTVSATSETPGAFTITNSATFAVVASLAFKQ